MKRLFIALCVGVSAQMAAAEQSEKALLEADNTIWVADDLTAASKAGLTIGFFPMVKFRDGIAEEGFATVSSSAIRTGPCPDPIFCPNTTHRATMLEGAYSLERGTLKILGPKLTNAVFDVEENAAILQAETLAAKAGIVLSLEKTAFAAGEGSDARRYLAFSEAELDQALGIIAFLERPMAEIGACVLRGHHARLRADRALPMERSLLALGAVGKMTLQRNASFSTIPTTPEEEREQMIAQVALTAPFPLLWEHMDLADMERAETGKWPILELSDAEIDALLTERMPVLLDGLDADIAEEAMRRIRTQTPAVIAAAPAAAALRAASQDRGTAQDLLCPEA